MKKSLLLALLMVSAFATFAQSEKKVKWDYSVRKIADKTYEVRMTASIGPSYHMFAQQVGVDGPLPTTFTFAKNPLIILNGQVKEEGKVVKKYESLWNGHVNYYENTVVFVQVVKLKANVKTDLAGKVEFMVCNERQCLPPSDVDIRVSIGG